MRLLVIDDDVDQCDFLTRILEKQGYAVDQAHDLSTAEYKWWFTPYDCVLLDRRLREGDALASLARWRSEGCGVPVLVISVLADAQQRVAGLDAGADGYLGKGIDPGELVDRVAAVCRRAPGPAATLEQWGEHRGRPARSVRWADLEIDFGARTLRRAGVRLFLTRTQFRLLELLLDARGRVVAPRTLIEHTWDSHAQVDLQTLRVHLGNLRAKLGEPDLIVNVRGEGYMLVHP